MIEFIREMNDYVSDSSEPFIAIYENVRKSIDFSKRYSH